MSLTSARAANVSFTGQFAADNDVALVSLVVGVPSLVTIRTWSYAGGINAAGTVIAEGGFDPILALYDDNQTLLGQQDDGGTNVLPSADTALAFDTFLALNLNPGTYYVALMQYRNPANGPTLSDGFLRAAQPNFTSHYGCSNGQFCDLFGHNRTNAWALDILNVDSAAIVPVPPAAWLLGSALGILGALRRRAT